MTVKIGERVPDFKAKAYINDHKKEEIREIKLSDYRGKWIILVFYPADFTFVCPTELEELALKYDTIRSLDAEVISISTDTPYVHKAWHDVSPCIRKIKFPMVGDSSGNICRAFGTLVEEEGISLRATFIIDPDGFLKALEIHDNSIGRNVEEIIRKLVASKYIREHPEEVCPASWEPGKKTLKPALELVGKI